MPDQNLDNCIDDCIRCHRTCLEMAAGYCLEQGGEHARPAHIQLMLACAEICQTAANVMVLGHEVHKHVCQACAKICDACADNCEEIGNMDACVEACRRCAESCRKMAPE